MFTIPNEAQSIEDPADVFPQAEPDKVDFDIIMAGIARSGVRTGCEVTAQASPDTTVAVAAGTVVIADTEVAVSAGNVSGFTSHATLRRFDLVAVNNAGTKSRVAGTAAASPVFPAIPADSVILAAVYVPAGDDAIQSAQIVDKRVEVPAPQTVAIESYPKSADQTLTQSDITPENITGLAFAISGVSGEVAAFEAQLHLNAASTAGFRFDWTLPAGATIEWLDESDGGTPSSGQFGKRFVAVVGAAEITSVKGSAGTTIYVLRGRIVSGATAGTAQLRAAQQTSQATDCKILRGSRVLVTRA